MGSLSYGLERAPSRLVFENALLGRQFVDFPIGNGKNRGRAQRAIFFLAGHTFQSNLGLFARNHMWIFRTKAPQFKARIYAVQGRPMCTRLPSPPPPSTRRRLHRRPFRRCPFRRRPFLHRLPCCRRLLTPLPPPLCPQPSSAAPASRSARLGSLGSALTPQLGLAPDSLGARLSARFGSDRSAGIGTARTARMAQHGCWNTAGGHACCWNTAAAARHALLSAWRSSAQLGSARLSSSRFVWLGLARLVQHDPHGSHLLGGAPCRRHLRAQPCAAQARRGAAAL